MVSSRHPRPREPVRRGTRRPAFIGIGDAETGELREAVLGAEAAAACRRKVEALSTALRQFCARRGIVYARAFGAANLETFMERELPALGVIH